LLKLGSISIVCKQQFERSVNGQKYTDIAKEYNCTAGHTKDEAYKLWQLLSKALGEDLNKLNFRAAIERISATNSNIFGNPVQVGSINFCPPSQAAESKAVESFDKKLPRLLVMMMQS
jgi:hypothetical protein